MVLNCGGKRMRDDRQGQRERERERGAFVTRAARDNQETPTLARGDSINPSRSSYLDVVPVCRRDKWLAEHFVALQALLHQQEPVTQHSDLRLRAAVQCATRRRVLTGRESSVFRFCRCMGAHRQARFIPRQRSEREAMCGRKAHMEKSFLAESYSRRGISRALSSCARGAGVSEEHGDM